MEQHPDVDEIDYESEEYEKFEQQMYEEREQGFRTCASRAISHSMFSTILAKPQATVKMTMTPGPDGIAPMTANGYPYPTFEW